MHLEPHFNGVLNRIIGASEYLNFREQRQEFFMLKYEAYAGCKQGDECIWCTKVKLLLRSDILVIVDGRTLFKELTMDLAFVQNFELVDPIDEIERETRCITIRWEQASHENIEGRLLIQEGKDPGKWCSLTPADSILPMVQIIPTITASMKMEVTAFKYGDSFPESKLDGWTNVFC